MVGLTPDVNMNPYPPYETVSHGEIWVRYWPEDNVYTANYGQHSAEGDDAAEAVYNLAIELASVVEDLLIALGDK